MTPRDAFPGYDDPIKIDAPFEDVVKTLLVPESDTDEDEDESEEE